MKYTDIKHSKVTLRLVGRRWRYGQKPRRQFVPRKVLWLVAGAAFLAGGYMMALTMAPVLMSAGQTAPLSVGKTIAATDTTERPAGDWLYIPKIGVQIDIMTGNETVLRNHAWHRKPELGDPQKGGNFILSGHRFELGLTPGQTKTKSPFYHIDKLSKGDLIFVDFQQKRYAYTVERIYDVANTEVRIEHASDQPKLTLYTCNIRGEAAGRVVVEALPRVSEPEEPLAEPAR